MCLESLIYQCEQGHGLVRLCWGRHFSDRTIYGHFYPTYYTPYKYEFV